MKLKTTDKEYGLVARGFHWTSALIVLALLSLGFYMAGLEYSPFKLQLYFWHKSFGILVLMLVTLRFCWRIYTEAPEPLASHKQWEKALSHIVHVLLYLGLITMPLSGWFMSSAGDFAASFFGLFDMPDLVSKDEALFKFLRQVHTWGAYALIVAIGLHALGAIKHHLIDKDDTLTRMGGHTIIIPAALILVAVPAFLAAQDIAPSLFPEAEKTVEEQNVGEVQDIIVIEPPSEDLLQGSSADTPQSVSKEIVSGVPYWTIVPEHSHIKFEATQYGDAFQGEFEEFSGDIYFDPDNLGASRADITIDIASIKTGSNDRDSQAKGSEWFDTKRFTSAFFQVRSFKREEANRFIAKGYLTIRGKTIPVSLPFTLDFEDSEDGLKTAKMEGTLSLNRLDFGIGQGEWKSTDTIGNAVNIMIFVRASKAVAVLE
ncbi:MAG: cytochrome b561 [Micavibrio sp.]|nr:MAG: cytochrome b561 [Micavibrio sp.]